MTVMLDFLKFELSFDVWLGVIGTIISATGVFLTCRVYIKQSHLEKMLHYDSTKAQVYLSGVDYNFPVHSHEDGEFFRDVSRIDIPLVVTQGNIQGLTFSVTIEDNDVLFMYMSEYFSNRNRYPRLVYNPNNRSICLVSEDEMYNQFGYKPYNIDLTQKPNYDLSHVLINETITRNIPIPHDYVAIVQFYLDWYHSNVRSEHSFPLVGEGGVIRNSDDYNKLLCPPLMYLTLAYTDATYNNKCESRWCIEVTPMYPVQSRLARDSHAIRFTPYNTGIRVTDSNGTILKERGDI